MPLRWTTRRPSRSSALAVADASRRRNCGPWAPLPAWALSAKMWPVKPARPGPRWVGSWGRQQDEAQGSAVGWAGVGLELPRAHLHTAFESARAPNSASESAPRPTRHPSQPTPNTASESAPRPTRHLSQPRAQHAIRVSPAPNTTSETVPRTTRRLSQRKQPS